MNLQRYYSSDALPLKTAAEIARKRKVYANLIEHVGDGALAEDAGSGSNS